MAPESLTAGAAPPVKVEMDDEAGGTAEVCDGRTEELEALHLGVGDGVADELGVVLATELELELVVVGSSDEVEDDEVTVVTEEGCAPTLWTVMY